MGHISYFNQNMEETPNPLDVYFVLFFYFFVIYAYFKYRFHYFTLKNVPVLSPSIPFGNIKKALKPKKPRYEYFQDLYSRIKIRGHDHAGVFLFFKPIYMPTNLDYVQKILGEDFDYFSDRGFYGKRKPRDFSGNLLNLQGHRWKELRVALTPIFATKTIKNFAVNVEKVSENLVGNIIVGNETKNLVSIQEIARNFSLDLVANVFYGVDLNSSVEKNTPFEMHTRKIFRKSVYNSKWFVFSMLFPGLYERLSLEIFPKKSLDYFQRTIREIISFRKVNQIKKNDILQAMIDENKNENMTIDDIISQCVSFTIFTNETVSNTLTFALYELSRNQQIQEELRNEIIKYDDLSEMTCLHQVIQETLRLYPPIPVISRRCTKDYNLPGNKETLDKGTGVLISTLGIHRDPELYENPNCFDPGRFNELNNNVRHPYAFIPYGEGPRICPAIKLSDIMLKIGLVSVVKRYKFSLSEKSKPLVLNKNCVLMEPKNILYLNVEKIEI